MDSSVFLKMIGVYFVFMLLKSRLSKLLIGFAIGVYMTTNNPNLAKDMMQYVEEKVADFSKDAGVSVDGVVKQFSEK